MGSAQALKSESVAAPPSQCPHPASNAYKFCSDKNLTAALAELLDPARLAGEEVCPVIASDLSPGNHAKGIVGDGASGAAFFGSWDVNGDQEEDVLLTYDDVDFWRWLFFVRERDCLRFAGFVDGYQAAFWRRSTKADATSRFTLTPSLGTSFGVPSTPLNTFGSKFESLAQISPQTDHTKRGIVITYPHGHMGTCCTCRRTQRFSEAGLLQRWRRDGQRAREHAKHQRSTDAEV